MFKHFSKFVLCFTFMSVLIPLTALADEKVNILDALNDPEPYRIELFEIPVTKEMIAKRLAITAKKTKAGLTLIEKKKIIDELIAFDKVLITTWAHTLKFADGEAFTRQFEPVLTIDKRLVNTFPDTFFYVMQFPGYFGGAAPTPQILRNFEVPLPLQRTNIIAVSKDANVKLMPDVERLTLFYQGALPLIKTENDARFAVASWLRLNQEFIWQFNQQPIFIISEKDFVVEKLPKDKLMQVTGKAIVDPKSMAKGDITLTIRFYENGKIADLKDEQHIEFDPIPLPPSAGPGGPGGGPKPMLQ